MIKRFTEKQLIKGLDEFTAHADELAELLTSELAAQNHSQNASPSCNDQVEPAQDWDHCGNPSSGSALFELIGPEFQQMPPLEVLQDPDQVILVVRRLLELGLTTQELSNALGLPVATLSGQGPKTFLEHGIPERIVRLLCMLYWTENLFEGDLRAAMDWVRSPAKALNGEAPIRMIGSDRELEAVRDIVGRLEHGIVQ